MKQLLTLLAIVGLVSLQCGRGTKKEETPEKSSYTHTSVTDESPPDPPSIDPDREEALYTGTDVEKLLAKYELLVERIRLERKNGVYNANVALNRGLIPIADDHHELLKEGLIDTTLHREISMLAVHVLADYLNQDNDPGGKKFAERMAKIRAMLPEHSSATGAAGSPPSDRTSE